jgi:dihydrodipicolinate synthase/N-acetylneuraminate lyase
MSRLLGENVRGVWAGVTMCWDEDYAFDEEAYRANTQAMCDWGVHGIYTTGSTGEFYALDELEFRRMVDIQAEICGAAGMPLQIGCCADATHKTVALLEYAASKPEVGAAQVVLPYWMELTDREVLAFFADLHHACPDLPLVHYNIPRAKRFLNGQDYLRILDVAPNLIGVKYTFAGSNFAALQDAMIATPLLSYFVAENLLASAMMLGARGTYSSLIATNPRFMLTMYEHARQGRWTEATRMQRTATQFFGDAAAFIEGRGEGTIDPVFDKGLSVAAGCAAGSARTRPPYIGWSDETVAAMRSWLEKHYPQFVYQPQPTTDVP